MSKQGPRRTSGLSLVQVLATVLAAVTSTFALSKLGWAGTVFGAGLASIITVVGNYLYTRWLVRTHETVNKLAKSATKLITGRAGAAEGPGGAEASPSAAAETDDAVTAALGSGAALAAAAPTDDAVTQVLTDHTAGDAASDTDQAAGDEPASDPGTADADAEDGNEATEETTEETTAPDRPLTRLWDSLVGRFGRKRMLVATVIVVFLVLLLLITGFELITGKSISSLMGDDNDRRTTIELPWYARPTAGLPTPTGPIQPTTVTPTVTANLTATASLTVTPDETPTVTSTATAAPEPTETQTATVTNRPAPIVTVTVTQDGTAPAPAPKPDAGTDQAPQPGPTTTTPTATATTPTPAATNSAVADGVEPNPSIQPAVPLQPGVDY